MNEQSDRTLIQARNTLNSLIMTKSSLKQSIQRQQIQSLILVQHTSDTSLHLSSIDNDDIETQSLRRASLTEFKDVFPPELPPGLPPRREVDHKIELLPGSKPTVRPTYESLRKSLFKDVFCKRLTIS